MEHAQATWFTYEYCTDISATKTFYSELLGLPQIWDTPENVAFRHDCVQLAFTLDDALPRQEGWAFQPGWCHGQLHDAPSARHVRSISLAMEPDAFRSAVTRLRAAGVEALRPEPFWVNYWSFVVRDPDGLTVELSDPHSPGPQS